MLLNFQLLFQVLFLAFFRPFHFSISIMMLKVLLSVQCTSDKTLAIRHLILFELSNVVKYLSENSAFLSHVLYKNDECI